MSVKIYILTAKHQRLSLKLRAFLDADEALGVLAACINWERMRACTHAAVKPKPGQSARDVYKTWYLTCPFGVYALLTGYSGNGITISVEEFDDEATASLEISVITAESQARDVKALNGGVW